MFFRQLFDQSSSTYTYLIADEQTKAACIVDPVDEQIERDLQCIRELKLDLLYAIETHIHADHITSAARLRNETGCQIILPCNTNATSCDREIQDNEIIQCGDVTLRALATPGHTDCHFAFLINQDRVLTGDALFIRGCGRTDFQSGDPGVLFDMITKKLFSLPDDTLVYPGHDYQGRTVSTIFEEKNFNPRLANKTRQEFIEIMHQLNLPMPKKIKEAVPANLQCGTI